MAPKFCCCLPLRLGVFIITLIQFLLCGAAAGGFWFLLRSSKDQGVYQSLQTNVKIALLVAGAVYTFAAFIGLLGFLGAIFRKSGLVRTYLALLYVTLMLQVASGIYSLVMFYRFRDNAGARADCIDDSTSSTRINYCDALHNFAKMPVWGVWVSSMVPIVIVAYACYVVQSYSKRLSMQKSGREIIATRSTATGPDYSAVKPHEENHPLTQPTYTYPYSDAPHSFGNTVPSNTGHAASYYNSDKV